MVKIRKYRPEDKDTVFALITSVMNEEFPQSISAFPVEDLANILEVYGQLGEAFFVAVDANDKAIGTAAIKREDNRIALLRRIFVAKSHRKQNIGFLLVKRTIAFCKEVGYEEIVFKSSTKMDRAIRLCERLGFVQRAKLEIGGSELLKFVLCFNHPTAAANR